MEAITNVIKGFSIIALIFTAVALIAAWGSKNFTRANYRLIAEVTYLTNDGLRDTIPDTARQFIPIYQDTIPQATVLHHQDYYHLYLGKRYITSSKKPITVLSIIER